MPDGHILGHVKNKNHEMLKILINKVEEIIVRINTIEERLCELENKTKEGKKSCNKTCEKSCACQI